MNSYIKACARHSSTVKHCNRRALIQLAVFVHRNVITYPFVACPLYSNILIFYRDITTYTLYTNTLEVAKHQMNSDIQKHYTVLYNVTVNMFRVLGNLHLLS